MGLSVHSLARLNLDSSKGVARLPGAQGDLVLQVGQVDLLSHVWPNLEVVIRWNLCVRTRRNRREHDQT
jgi:hypothetical protein